MNQLGQRQVVKHALAGDNGIEIYGVRRALKRWMFAR